MHDALPLKGCSPRHTCSRSTKNFPPSPPSIVAVELGPMLTTCVLETKSPTSTCENKKVSISGICRMANKITINKCRRFQFFCAQIKNEARETLVRWQERTLVAPNQYIAQHFGRLWPTAVRQASQLPLQCTSLSPLAIRTNGSTIPSIKQLKKKHAEIRLPEKKKLCIRHQDARRTPSLAQQPVNALTADRHQPTRRSLFAAMAEKPPTCCK